MNQIRRDKFKIDYVGLQIYWEEYEEIEFLGPSVLSGSSKSNTTAALYMVGRIARSCRYPVSASRTGKELKITYKDKPMPWPERGVVPGTLTIHFKDSSGIEPESIFFRGVEADDEDEPVNEEDWAYHSAAPQFEILNLRGRITTTRLERKGQQLLRNQLISEHGACQITGTRCASALEACHIVPVQNGGHDRVENALLLRCDLHKLFDAGLLRFTQTDGAWIVNVDEGIVDEQYRAIHGVERLTGTTAAQCHYLAERLKLEI